MLAEGARLVYKPGSNREGKREIPVQDVYNPLAIGALVRVQRSLTSAGSNIMSRLKGKVLVIDDDPSLLRALTRQLLALDFEVMAFDSAEAFLAAHIDARNACLLLDIYLPGMSGVELCQVLAASGRSLPTILMTARDDEATARSAGVAGAVGIVYKPFDEEVLLGAIGRAFSAR
jgi:FixJ family two-component response regulator